jgi:hypothetical protein
MGERVDDAGSGLLGALFVTGKHSRMGERVDAGSGLSRALFEAGTQSRISRHSRGDARKKK